MDYQKRKRELKQKAIDAACSKEELKELYSLINHYGSASELDELLKTGWNALEADEKINEQRTQEVFGRIKGSIAGGARKSLFKRRALQMAASFALLFLVFFGWEKISQHQSNAVALIVKEAGVGKVTKTTLTDGTIIWLNSGSRISFPKAFGANVRMVSLEGEAFFQVNHDENRPFIIQTGQFTTRVLGTSFNVAAYHDAPYAVTVATGKVKVKHKEQSVFLTKGQQADFDALQQKFNEREVHPDNFSGWRFGVLHLNGRLSDALKAVERKYGVKVLFEDEQLKSYEIEATYKNELLVNVLKSIEYSMGVKVTLENNTVKILNKTNKNQNETI